MPSSNVRALAKGSTVLAMMRPITEKLSLPDVTEVCVNRPGELWVEQGPAWVKFDMPELTMNYLLDLAQAIATFSEQEIGPRKPILSAMLPNQERIQIVVPPAVEDGTVSYSIRRPGDRVKELSQYKAEGMFDKYVWAKSPELQSRACDLSYVDKSLIEALENNDLGLFFERAVRGKKNIAVIGDTGSGKTTLMKSICQIIPMHERPTTIEDVRELFIQHPNRVHLLYSKGGQGVAQVTPADLISANMRMKPSRVLLAELRGAEAFDFLKLLTTGHSGSITSFHAESCALGAERYVFMCREHPSAQAYDSKELKRLVSLTIDVIVHVVAEEIFDDEGRPVRKDRYVAEVSFDPIAKLVAKYGDATLHHAK